MEMGEFRVNGLEYLEDSPGPKDGQAIVLVPEPQPLPNALTIEGVIQGSGLMAANARRQGGWAKRVVMFIIFGIFVLPTAMVIISNFTAR